MKNEEETEEKKYDVVFDFKDLKDNDRIYIKDDPYPAEGAKKPTPERIKELSSTKNKMKRVLIKERD
ncbi:hypothetical protein ABW02_06805 [Niallia circulans]|uniref:Uncharacterized protein n=1 Tax=Niallia circulans TaxID=1397 RepID=A0A0J1IN43_NIACI|nr:hypothetical protein ABW02_06805 [Niallia circulans]